MRKNDNVAVSLTENQKKACLVDHGRAVVSAGAGSGKTRVLVERFVRLVREKRSAVGEILTVTFTHKAAGEMRERILRRFEEEGMLEERLQLSEAPIGTIHAFCSRLLAEHRLRVPVSPGSRIAGRAVLLNLLEREIRARLEKAFALRGGDPGEKWLFETFGWKGLLAGTETCFARLRSLGLSPQSLLPDAGEEEPGSARQLKAAFKNFVAAVGEGMEKEKRRLGLLDHDDLQLLARDLLREHPEIADRIRRRFRFYMVDEYQDINPLQEEILRLLHLGKNDFVVGDKKQAIYAFRYTDAAVFAAREKECPVHRLEENFRSSPEVIDFVNSLFSRVWKGDSAVDYRPLVAAGGPRGGRQGGVEIALVDRRGDGEGERLDLGEGREQEAAWIARKTAQLLAGGGYRPSEIVLLLRATTSLQVYQKAFAAAKIPLFLVSGRGFYAQTEIYDAVNLLKVLLNPGDDLPLLGFLRSPFAGVSDETLYWCALEAKGGTPALPLWRGVEGAEKNPRVAEQEKRKIREALETLERLRGCVRLWSFPRLIEEGLRAFDYGAKTAGFSDAAQRLANLQKLIKVAHEYETTFPAAGPADLVAHLDRLERTEPTEEEASIEEEAGEAVRVMTIHKSKGLEFPVVFVADLGRRDNPLTGDFRFGADGSFALKILDPETGRKTGTPFFDVLTREQKGREWEEKKRLFYVAATRARERLFLVGTASFRDPDKKEKRGKGEADPNAWAGKPWSQWLVSFLGLDGDSPALPKGTEYAVL